MSEKLSEGRDDLTYQLRHLTERYENRLTLDNPRLIERYLNSELHVRIHFCKNGILNEWVADFQRELAHPSGQHEEVGKVIENAVPSLSNVRSDIDGAVLSGGSYQKAVLAEVVKCMEMPEPLIPSVVRFDIVDRFYSVVAESLYFSRRLGFVLCGGLRNGKANVPRDGTAIRIVLDEQLDRQIVESTPKIEQGVPADQKDIAWSRIEPRNVVDELSRLRIFLDREFVGVGFLEGYDGSLQITDVLVGPFDL